MPLVIVPVLPCRGAKKNRMISHVSAAAASSAAAMGKMLGSISLLSSLLCLSLYVLCVLHVPSVVM